MVNRNLDKNIFFVALIILERRQVGWKIFLRSNRVVIFPYVDYKHGLLVCYCYMFKKKENSNMFSAPQEKMEKGRD